MDFNSIASQVIVALITGVVGYVVNKIERVREAQSDLKKDLDAAFKKIRQLEGKSNAGSNRQDFGEDAGEITD
jgi:uncharacterized membrane protein